MTRKFTVYAHTTASASLYVDLDDADLAEVAESRGVEVGKLTLDDLREVVVERALDRAPRICAQCSGWGRRDYSLDLGEDSWVLDGDDADPAYPVEDVIERAGD